MGYINIKLSAGMSLPSDWEMKISEMSADKDVNCLQNQRKIIKWN
jgi:hypothetical protein